MIIAIILALISIGFLVLAIKGNKMEPAVKTKKLLNGIRILLLISPLIAAAIFAVLFCTVLTGRLVERSGGESLILSKAGPHSASPRRRQGPSPGVSPPSRLPPRMSLRAKCLLVVH